MIDFLFCYIFMKCNAKLCLCSVQIYFSQKYDFHMKVNQLIAMQMDNKEASDMPDFKGLEDRIGLIKQMQSKAAR